MFRSRPLVVLPFCPGKLAAPRFKKVCIKLDEDEVAGELSMQLGKHCCVLITIFFLHVFIFSFFCNYSPSIHEVVQDSRQDFQNGDLYCAIHRLLRSFEILCLLRLLLHVHY